MELIEETLGGGDALQEAVEIDGVRYIRGPFYSNRQQRRAHRSSGEERREKMRSREGWERGIQRTAKKLFSAHRKMGGK